MRFAVASVRPLRQISKCGCCLILLLFLSACAGMRTPPSPRVPVGSEVLLERLQTLAVAFDSLRGEAKVRIETEGKSFSGTQVLLAQKPDLLRAETLNPFGTPVLVVTANPEQINVLVPGEGRFLRGESSFRNIQRFTRLPLQLSDLVHLLLYQVPVVPFTAARVDAGENGGHRLLLEGEGGVLQELDFDRQLRLVRAIYFEAGERVLDVAYDRFTADAPPFPRSLQLEIPGQRSAASLSFSAVDLNRPISADLFSLLPPAGYSTEPL